jgi:hypothetical protein
MVAHAITHHFDLRGYLKEAFVSTVLELVQMLRCSKRSFDLIDLEEAVVVKGLGTVVAQEFTSNGLDVPEWLSNQQKALKRLISLKAQEALEAKLKRAQARRATLMTPTEQREQLDAEIAALEAAVGSSS